MSPRPATLGRKALKWARRQGVPTVVVEQSPVLDLTADYWRAKVADRADRLLVTSHWMRERVAEFGVDAELWAPGVDTAAFTPALRDQWLHDTWSRKRSRRGRARRGRVRRQPAQAPRRTPPGGAGLRRRHPDSWSSATGRSADGWSPACPGAKFTGAPADRRPDRRPADPRRAGPPRRARDLQPRAARGRSQRGAGGRAPRRRCPRRRAPPRDRAALRPIRPEGPPPRGGVGRRRPAPPLLGQRARELATRTWADAVADLLLVIGSQVGAPA